MSKKSNVIIDKHQNLVIKTPLKWVDIVFDREIYWLKKFDGSEYFPHFISAASEKKEIHMTYCGEPINKKNCPKDWKAQVENILAELTKYKCAHNDIKQSEVLVLDGRIKLVDFGWSTIIGDPIPSDWPINLGIVHRIGIHKFDDRFALQQILGEVLNDL